HRRSASTSPARSEWVDGCACFVTALVRPSLGRWTFVSKARGGVKGRDARSLATHRPVAASEPLAHSGPEPIYKPRRPVRGIRYKRCRDWRSEETGAASADAERQPVGFYQRERRARGA